jgi:hypothetical protein
MDPEAATAPTAPEETFTDIPGYPNYQISPSGLIRNKKTLRILRQNTRTCKLRSYRFCKIKSVAGTFDNVNIHRAVALTYIPNTDNKPCVDHIDNNSLNNHVSNLRWATTAENNQNRCLSILNTSGFKNVYFHKTSKKWMAYITKDHKMKYLGIYSTKEEAAIAAAEARTIAHGEFARGI